LRTDLHLSVAQLGLLASLASGTGALCALPAGGLVDRRHRPMIVAAALVVWSLALGLAGFATGLALLAVARLVSGGIATIARPVAVSLIGDIYRPEDRGSALARLDAGQAVGAAVCFLLGALAVSALSWRWLFWWLATAGVLLGVIASRLHEPTASRPPAVPLPVVLRTLLHIRTNLIVLAADSVGNFFFAGVASFSVLFITSRYGLSTAMVDALAPAFAVGVVAGILAGGRLGDRYARTAGGGRRLLIASACQMVSTAIFAIALLNTSLVLTSVLFFVGATVLGGAGPCLDAVRLDIVSESIRGRAEAARGLLTLASSTIGPVTFGLVATAFAGGRNVQRGADGLALRNAFLLMLIPLGVGSLILLAARRPYEHDAAEAAAASRPI
jgi:MFS family permease